MKDLEAFRERFSFKPTGAFLVGVERECFVTNSDGNLVPQSQKILSCLKDILKLNGTGFGYELSACQIESRVGPCFLEELHGCLNDRDAQLNVALDHCGLSVLHTEVGPEDMSLEVYPDPTGRYQQIVKNLPREILLAACRVIGTHVHIGMRDHDTALHVYNYVIRHLAELCEVGDGSSGERLAIYKQMAPDYEPKPYASWDGYYQTALAKGFAEDPRKCWTLIRISVHGTIEFRMFGTTDSTDRVVDWATRCHELCQEAMMHA
jgi:gamma-glutamyl:cysteine ligase YbdK (ATP-grasp superfamily)